MCLSPRIICLFAGLVSLLPGEEAKSPSHAVTYVAETGREVDFGKTDATAYTPAIRDSMRQLYEDKFGLFVHFGPYAQLEGIWQGEEVTAEWIMNIARIPVADYEKHAAGPFRPHRFDAHEWVDIAQDAGMKFIVITAKHHDGFAMFDSAHPYNLVDFGGFGRDLIKELADASAERGMRFGFYYSQSQDWHEPGGVGNDWDFGSRTKPQPEFDAYFQNKTVPQIEELTTRYGDIFMVWFDTPVQMDDDKCRQLMDIVARHQPGALVNSRLGQGFGHFDVSIDHGKTPSVSKSAWLADLKVPWQTHDSLTYPGWGYTRYGAENDRSHEHADFIYEICRIVGSGGVYLLNVGPRPDGTIPETQVDSLRTIGRWLRQNGESIYGADPSPFLFPPYAITSKPGRLFLHIRDSSAGNAQLQGLLSTVQRAYALADESRRPLKFQQRDQTLTVMIPESLRQPEVTVVVLELADRVARVWDETLQQQADGVIHLPVSRCEFATRRISYDFDKQVTFRWGESPKQGLIWTVDVKQPGVFAVFSEDNCDETLAFELITADDRILLRAEGELDVMQRRQRGSSIRITQSGVQKIMVFPKTPSRRSARFSFKGLELVPEN